MEVTTDTPGLTQFK